MSQWVDFWDRPNALYVNRRNLEVHFECLARDVEPYVPRGGTVLDFGCGDALAAERLAEHAGRLHLFDAAPSVRQRLRSRFAGHPRIRVLDPGELAALPAGSVDLVLAVSVIQYISRSDLSELLKSWRTLLKPEGCLLLADVATPETPILRDIASQLALARRHGFTIAALWGLVRMALSDYRQIRRQAGFSTYQPDHLIDLVGEAELGARLLERNVGPTPHRYSLLAVPKVQ